ncbi:MAG: sigma-70 family RNA polymerase sigma factor [Nitrospirota bacterium]|nr:sigma-70 family RNA polymerase sigma factor [Nitrospirota bacterium]
MGNRLAWAVAFNMEGPPDVVVDGIAAPRRGARRYKDHWPFIACFADIWSRLTKSWISSNPGHTSTLLDELGLSVLCEQKSEWQEPLSRLVDVKAADEVFKFVYVRNKAKVVGRVRKVFGERADSPEDIADEAWTDVFRDYWSSEARRRFLGTSQISTMVCQMALYKAIDRIREKGAFVTEGGSVGDAADEPRGSVLDSLAVFDDPTEHIAGQQLKRRIRECIDHQLPFKQGLVAAMVWLEDKSAKEVAESLLISEPAVSQHLKKARETLRPYLKMHGFDLPS